MKRSTISKVTKFTYLGIDIDDGEINWKKHLEGVCSKADKVLNFFKSICFNGCGFPEAVKRRMYTTFLRPMIECQASGYAAQMATQILVYRNVGWQQQLGLGIAIRHSIYENKASSAASEMDLDKCT